MQQIELRRPMARYVVRFSGEVFIDAENIVQANKLAQDYRVIGVGVGWRWLSPKERDGMRFEKHSATISMEKPRKVNAASTRTVLK